MTCCWLRVASQHPKRSLSGRMSAQDQGADGVEATRVTAKHGTPPGLPGPRRTAAMVANECCRAASTEDPALTLMRSRIGTQLRRGHECLSASRAHEHRARSGRSGPRRWPTMSCWLQGPEHR